MPRRSAFIVMAVFCLCAGLSHAQKAEFGVVTGVDSNWKTVTLSQTYNSMVVVCTPNYAGTAPPAVVRVTNAVGNSFQLLAQNPGNVTPITNPISVYYLVVEEGVYNEAQHGVKMEAVKFLSDLTTFKGSWNINHPRSYQQSYDNPVVVGQVMTAADPLWSVFWSSDGSQGNPPSPSALAVGKHVGEDTNQVRAAELLGYIVIEEGAGLMSGQPYTAAVGPDIVEGISEGTAPWTYNLSPLVSVAGGAFSETAQDGADGSWAVLAGSAPFGPGTADLGVDEDQIGDTDRAHTNDQIAYIAFGTLPAASVDRSVPGLIADPGVPVTVTLTATRLAGGQIVVSETVPTGLTPANITSSAGGNASFAGGVITWTVTVGTSDETLTYDVTPGAAPDRMVWSANYTDSGSGVTGLAVTGDEDLIVRTPLGNFDWHGDNGFQPLGQATGNPSRAGTGIYDGTSLYTITGAGADVQAPGDRCHMAAKLMSGSYVMDAFVSWQDPANLPHNWSKAGVMVRNRVRNQSAMMMTFIRNPANTGNGGSGPGDVIVEGRRNETSAYFGPALLNTAPATAPNVWVRILRMGDQVSGFTLDESTSQWALVSQQTITDMTSTQTFACVFVTSHVDDGTGASPGAEFATALFDSITLTPLAISGATRSFGSSRYVVGIPLAVAIDILAVTGPVAVTETIPAGWTALNISDGGTQTGNAITWNLNQTGDIRLTYSVMAVGGTAKLGVFDGIVTDTTAGMDIPISGPTQILRQNIQPIILIVETNSGRHGPPGSGTHDGNIQDALGVGGLTIGATTVPGLGYSVQVVDDDGADNQNYGPADTICIVVSETVGSGGVFDHFADPVPLVMNEQALMDDRSGRCSMHFSEGNGAADTNQMNITDNTHPITSIFPPGNLVINAGRQISLMQGAIAPDAQVLAVSPLAGEPCLAVFEAGVSGLMNPDPQDIPTVARRVGLGFHEDAMTTPTAEGVYLYQRAVQWAIGEPVTAGTVAPAAPSNASGLVSGRFVDVTWADNSDNENGFVISREEDGTGVWIDVGQVGQDGVSFEDRTVEEGKTYNYRVRAFNPTGDSPESNIAGPILIVPQLRTKSWQLYR